MLNSQEGFKGRFGHAGENIKYWKLLSLKKQKKKTTGRNLNRTLVTCKTPLREPTSTLWESQKENIGAERIFEEIWLKCSQGK